MKILKPTAENIVKALDVLRHGGTVVHATETCYGLACDLSNPAAVTKLFAIKHRPVDQPVSALFESIEQAKQYVMWNGDADAFAREYLPGPLTLILPVKQNDPHTLYSAVRLPLAADRSIGIRISSHPLAQQLVIDFGSPLSTTSVNIHGRPPLYDAQGIFQEFSRETDQPDLILDSGVLPTVPPSRVVDCTKRGVPKILRT